MKKLKTVWICLLCICMTACSNEFARLEYESDEKISRKEDHYSKTGSVSHSTDKEYSLKVSKFNGRQTIWNRRYGKDQQLEADISFRLSEGLAKIVHIDGEGNVTTIIECAPESSTDGFVTKTVSLKKGRNRLKIVGYDCKDIQLEMMFL